MEVGVKVCFPRFQKGLKKDTSISLLPVTEGGGFNAFPIPIRQMPRRGRLSNLQTRLPGRSKSCPPLLHRGSWELRRRGTAGLLIRSTAPPSTDNHLHPPPDRSREVPFRQASGLATAELKDKYQGRDWGGSQRQGYLSPWEHNLLEHSSSEIKSLLWAQATSTSAGYQCKPLTTTVRYSGSSPSHGTRSVREQGPDGARLSQGAFFSCLDRPSFPKAHLRLN